MPSFLERAQRFFQGQTRESKVLEQAPEQKFNPADAGVDWTYVQHLVMTANTDPLKPSDTGDGNSAVFACLRALALASIEPPLRVFSVQSDDSREHLAEHPLQTLLDEPNPWLDMDEIRFWIAWVKNADGNAYLLKVRSGDATGGLPTELWPISPSKMKPWTNKGSRNFIDGFRWTHADGKVELVPPENVIHFKFGTDDRDPRLGLSPLKRLVREIASDAEATRWMDALTKNFGIPGLVVELPATGPNNTPLPPIPPDRLKAMKEDIKQTYGTDQRGGVGLLTGGAVMKQFGFSPEQMNLKALHEVPETRICAVLGVDPLVARLGVGLEQTSNYASARQVRENFTENTLNPMWTMDEKKWNRQLKPDFTGDKNVIVAHDLTKVRALQEDQDALWKRVTAAVQFGVITADAAVGILGLPPDAAPKPLPAPTGPPGQDGKPNTPAGRVGAGLTGLALKEGDFERWPELMQTLVDLATPGMAEEFDRLMDATRRRLKHEILSEA